MGVRVRLSWGGGILSNEIILPKLGSSHFARHCTHWVTCCCFIVNIGLWLVSLLYLFIRWEMQFFPKICSVFNVNMTSLWHRGSSSSSFLPLAQSMRSLCRIMGPNWWGEEGVKYLDLHDDRCQRTPSYVTLLIQPSLSPHSDCNQATNIHKPRQKYVSLPIITSVMLTSVAPQNWKCKSRKICSESSIFYSSAIKCRMFLHNLTLILSSTFIPSSDEDGLLSSQ